ADRARGGAESCGGDREGSGLPARDRARRGVAEAAWATAERRLAPGSHRMGGAIARRRRLLECRPHAGDPGEVREVAGRDGAGTGGRGRDRGDGRRRRALVRPAVSLPLVPARSRQVRADAAAELGEAAAERRGAVRRAAAERARIGQSVPRARARREEVKVAEAVGRTLVAHGADHVFGVVGSGNFHVTNAMTAAGARFVAAAHEGGAASMADGYARVSGRLAALSVHQGPGITNALTGIVEAAKSRTPLVVLAPEAASPRSNFFIDLPGIAAAIGAGYRRVSADRVASDV